MHMHAKLFVFFAILMFAVPAAAQDVNLTEGCITNYSADVDYFPEKDRDSERGKIRCRVSQSLQSH